MVLPIVIAPNKILIRPCRKVERRELPELRRLFDDMCETMQDIGVGLAAPQVGKGIRLFIAMNPETEEVRPFLNPQIVAASRETNVASEGCLSIPGQVADVERHLAVVLRFQDLDFQDREERFDGFAARIVQHELDHLNGVLLFDRAIGGMKPEPDEPTEEVGENGELSPAAERRRKRRERLGAMQTHLQAVPGPDPLPRKRETVPPQDGAQ